MSTEPTLKPLGTEATCAPEHPNLAIMRELVEKRAFASYAAEGDAECMIHVAWSGAFDKDDDGRGHLVRRGSVIASLGMPPPDPPFTSGEMEKITFAAKMQALKCLRLRKRKKGA